MYIAAQESLNIRTQPTWLDREVNKRELSKQYYTSYSVYRNTFLLFTQTNTELDDDYFYYTTINVELNELYY